MALYTTRLTGKSNCPVWMKGADLTKEIWVELRNVIANATFVLPANVRLTGEVLVANASSSNQAAVTVGTSAAGTQITAGAVVGSGFTRLDLGTPLAVSNTDRTIYVESTAWNATGNGVHVFMRALEFPMVADRNAKS